MTPLRLLPLLLLAACQAPMAPPDSGGMGGAMPLPVLPSGADDTCGVGGFARLIGQDESAVASAAFAGPVRVIHPGDAVTMDFNAARANVETDAAGRITRIRCG